MAQQQQIVKGDDGSYDFSNAEDEMRMDYDLQAEHMIEFLDKTALAEGSHVLEIGCGFGFLLPHYQRRIGASGSVTLSDPEPKFGARLTPLLGNNGRFVACGGEDVAEKCRCVGSSDGYDLVVLGNVLHHLKDVGRTLAGVKSVLRPGGQVVVFDFLLYSFNLYTSAPHNFVELLRPEMNSTPARCVELLAAAGLSPRRDDNYVLRGKPGSQLWRLYFDSFLPMLMEERCSSGHFERSLLDRLVAKELPEVANDAGAVLFGDVIIQVAAAKE